MEFIINNDKWEIQLISAENLLQLYKEKEDEEARYAFGVTLYPDHKILINRDMCEAQQVKTLKHELAHCWIWNSGLFNVPHFTEEMVCDFASCTTSWIEKVANDFIKYKSDLCQKIM